MSSFSDGPWREAHAHLQAGRLPEAQALLLQAIDEDPGSFQGNYMLGIVLAAMKDAPGAIAAFQQAVAIDSNHGELRRNLGALLAGSGKVADALPHFQRAAELEPDNAQTHLFLGQALQQLNRHEEALAPLERAVALSPTPDANFRLAMTEERLGRDEAAGSRYLDLLRAQPGHIEAAQRLSDILCRRGAFAEAIRMLDAVAKLKPEQLEITRRLGMTHRMAGRKAEAAAFYRQVVARNPRYVEAHMELGELLLELRDPAGAVTAFRNALAAKPGHAEALHRLYYGLMSFCAWEEASRIVPAIDRMTDEALAAGRPPIEPPFLNLIHCDDAMRNGAIAQAWGRALAATPAEIEAAHIALRPPASRLRIGYLSYDFRNHAVAQLTARLFELHDRAAFDIVIYSYGPDDGSALRQRIVKAGRFVDISSEDFVGAARRIAADGIDILVDLAGHTMNSRLKIMAFRPAPVQATWLGFPGTTGCSFVDYLISDAIVTPPDQAAAYTEKLVSMPDTFQPNDDRQAISPLPVTRRDEHLPDGVPVFCSFNRPYKIEPVMFDAWMRILAALPGSVLWLHEGPPALMENLRREALARGIKSPRLVFAGRPDKAQHLRRLALADLALDTRIYNGHTTTSDALWAGVPVVTLLGKHFASRVSASALNAIGLPQLIAADLDAYVALAIQYGGDREANLALRETLRQKRESAPLFDSLRFTRHLENAYRLMWERHQSKQKPAAIRVPS